MTTHRKLAAILSADAAGYSRLMADDEAATVRSLNDARALFRERIESHGGRLIDTAGDSVLAEFPSAVEAVDCAVEIQHELAKRNAQFAEHRRMLFRIGINLGDVIEQEDGTIYGDGVNVAARLQALADPGGICVSGTAFDQVEGKLPLAFKFIGEQQVKNIPKPVRAYKVLMETPVGKSRQAHGSKRRAVAISAAAIVAVVVSAGVVWKVQKPTGEHAAQLNDPTLPMPSGPSIAVLPFTNMSGDPKEDYFSDGLTEDIITELARFRELNVLARNTTFQYKGQAVDVPTVGEKLGVQYVMEGSVRRTKDRVRITAQLIDSKTGGHIWADRYDREVRDIFAVQEEIAARIVGTITGTGGVVQHTGREMAARKRPDKLLAYDYVLQATFTTSRWSKTGYPKSKALLQKAIELDPRYARARQEQAWGMLIAWIFRLEDTVAPPTEIKMNAIKSVELDPGDALTHRTAAFGYYFDRQSDLFKREVDLAVSLAPNDAEILAELGFLLAYSGQYDRGAQLAMKAFRLNPDSAGGWYNSAMYYYYFWKGQYREALEVIRLAPPVAQQLLENRLKYVAVYGHLGDIEKAHEAWEKCREIDPRFSVATVIRMYRIWNAPAPLLDRVVDGYAKAGYSCIAPDCK